MLSFRVDYVLKEPDFAYRLELETSFIIEA